MENTIKDEKFAVYVVKKGTRLYQLNKLISELSVHFMKYNIEKGQLGAHAFLLENEAIYGLKANVLFEDASKEGVKEFLTERRNFYKENLENLEGNFKRKRAKSEIDATESIAQSLGFAMINEEESTMETQTNIFNNLDNNIDNLAARLEDERGASGATIVSATQKTMIAEEKVKAEVKKFVYNGQANVLENHLLAKENNSEGDKHTAVCFAERCAHELQYGKTRG